MFNVQFNTAEFNALEKKLSSMGKLITDQDYDKIMRKALKPVKEHIKAIQPKSINNSRYSYSSAQKSIEKYGLLEKAIGISKQKKGSEIGEHSYFVGYAASRGLKAFVSVFLNYGTNSPNFLRRLQFMQQAEKSTLNQVQDLFLEGMQTKFDELLAEYG
jgi:hypothetical protein